METFVLKNKQAAGLKKAVLAAASVFANKIGLLNQERIIGGLEAILKAAWGVKWLKIREKTLIMAKINEKISKDFLVGASWDFL